MCGCSTRRTAAPAAAWQSGARGSARLPPPAPRPRQESRSPPQAIDLQHPATNRGASMRAQGGKAPRAPTLLPWFRGSVGRISDALHNQNLFRAVDLVELDLDNLLPGGLHHAAHEAGLDRQLAVSAVDQHQQLHAIRAAMVEERIERRARGAAGVEHVIDQHDIAAVHIEADLRRVHHGADIVRGEVIAIELDVELPHVYRLLLNGFDQCCQALRQRNTPALDPDQAQPLAAMVFLDNLVSQTDQRAFDLGRRKDASLFAEACCVFHSHGCGPNQHIAGGKPSATAASHPAVAHREPAAQPREQEHDGGIERAIEESKEGLALRGREEMRGLRKARSILRIHGLQLGVPLQHQLEDRMDIGRPMQSEAFNQQPNRLPGGANERGK